MSKQETHGQEESPVGVEVDEKEEADLREVLKGTIKVAVADAGVLRKKVSVTVPRDSMSQELDKEYKQLVAEAVVPGFRRGRAPRRLVEKRFGSDVGAQVQTRLISNAYLAAIEKEDLRVLGDPLFWVKLKDKKTAPDEDGKEQLVDMPTALQNMKLPEDGDLEFKCEVEVKPEFKLPSLDEVTVERPDVQVTDEDVTTQIDRERARRGTWVPVNDGKVAIDDLLICDLVMTVDGKEFKKQENMQIAARPQRIEGVTLEDLGDSFKGAKVGDIKKLTGTIPEEYEDEELRGKKAGFEFKLNDIKRMELPPLDKEYLTNQGFESEKEYREWVKKAMQGQVEQEIKKGMRNQVRKYFLDHTKLELPEGLSARQTDRAVMRKMIELQRYGIPTAEIEKHADELRTSAREEVSAELKLHFILEDVAEKLEVDVTEEEVNGQIAEMARAYNRRFDRVRDDLAKNDGLNVLALQIREDKCLDRVLEKAKITETKVPKKGAEKPDKAEKAEKSEKSDKPKKAAKEETAPKAAEKKTAEKPAADKPAKKASKKKTD